MSLVQGIITKVMIVNIIFQTHPVTLSQILQPANVMKNADQIVVLEKGKIVEAGTHAALAIAKGKYFEQVKNQLELGN